VVNLARLLFFWEFFLSAQAFCYPDYAARHNVISCTACHYSPTGGGPKTVYGKLYGAHNFNQNPLLQQDYISGDFRALLFVPEKPKTNRGGSGVMSGSIAGHLALDEKQSIHLILESNFGGFTAAPQADAYALFRFSPEVDRRWLETLVVGRFHSPFGLMTDEHRTYTRVQTITEWYYRDTGLMVSGSPIADAHYDLAFVNGDRVSDGTLHTGNAQYWGYIANLRWMPNFVMWGLSGNYYDRGQPQNSPQALSAYAVIAISRATFDRVPLSLRLEHVRARNYDSHLAQGFSSDVNYVNTLTTSYSYGYLAQLEWALTEHFLLNYKFDLLVPDRDFPADHYGRHGIGFRWWVGPNINILARAEKAQATPPTEKNGIGLGKQNDVYGVLQITF
jgi:hypothetical protein